VFLKLGVATHLCVADILQCVAKFRLSLKFWKISHFVLLLSHFHKFKHIFPKKFPTLNPLSITPPPPILTNTQHFRTVYILCVADKIMSILGGGTHAMHGSTDFWQVRLNPSSNTKFTYLSSWCPIDQFCMNFCLFSKVLSDTSILMNTQILRIIYFSSVQIQISIHFYLFVVHRKQKVVSLWFNVTLCTLKHNK
jgi:hypothetical protein